MGDGIQLCIKGMSSGGEGMDGWYLGMTLGLPFAFCDF